MDDQKKINLFISYAREDSDHLKELLKYLEQPDLYEIIDVWYDERISPGSEWNEKIIENLNKSDIVILMLSVDFLRSGYIEKTELKHSYERREKNECEVIPLFIRKCSLNAYKHISDLNGLPRNQSWILSMGEKKEEGFVEIQDGIKNKAIEILAKKKKEKNSSARSKETAVALQVQPVKEVGSGYDTLQNTKLIESNDNIYAILIANYKFSKLKDKDIPSVHTNLKELENAFKTELNFKNVFPIDNKKCSDIQVELERIIKKCPVESTLLLYYSGHGLIESNSFYLASEDTALDDEDNNKLLETTAVSAQNVKDRLDKCKAKHKVLIFDCCYSSAFLNNSLSVDDNRYIKQTFENKDTYYLFSSVENKVSLYPKNEPNRPTYFTEALLKALKTGVEPKYEYCSFEQIFELTTGELEKIKDPSGIPVPKAIKPDKGPLEEIKICANPKYVRRSVEKELNTDFGTLKNEEIILWINSRTRLEDPDIEKALNTLIKRYNKKIELIGLDSSDKESKDKITMLKDMIPILEIALKNKDDQEIFKDAFKLHEKKFFEFNNSQKQEVDKLANNAALQNEKDPKFHNVLLKSEDLKANTESPKSFKRH